MFAGCSRHSESSDAYIDYVSFMTFDDLVLMLVVVFFSPRTGSWVGVAHPRAFLANGSCRGCTDVCRCRAALRPQEL